MLNGARSLLVVMVMTCGTCFAQDIEARFAQYQLQRAQANEGMSVLMERISVTDGWERVPDIDFKATPKFRMELASKRTLQRFVVSSNGLRKRVDGLDYSLFGSADLSDEDRESQFRSTAAVAHAAPCQNQMARQRTPGRWSADQNA